MTPAFTRYIGIDCSGAQTPESSLKGLRIYCADGAAAAQEVAPLTNEQKARPKATPKLIAAEPLLLDRDSYDIDINKPQGQQAEAQKTEGSPSVAIQVTETGSNRRPYACTPAVGQRFHFAIAPRPTLLSI